MVVPAYNEERTLHICLESLAQQDTTTPFEVIVVNNASTDKTAQVAERFGAIVVNEAQKGTTYARRTGCEIARGAIIASTDAETAVPKDWLRRIEEIFAHNKNIVALGGPYEFYDAGERWGLKFFYKVVLPAGFRIDFVLNGFRHYLAASNLAFRRSAYQRVGGWHTGIQVGEDVELTKRLNKVGRVLYIRRLIVMTSARRYNNGFWRPLYHYLMNHFELQLGFRKPRHNYQPPADEID